MNSKNLIITNIEFGNPDWGQGHEIFAEVSCAETGEMCLKTNYLTAMHVIEAGSRKFNLLNDHEVVDLINLMLGIDYSSLAKYGKLTNNIKRKSTS